VAAVTMATSLNQPSYRQPGKSVRRDNAGDMIPLTLTSNIFRLLDLSRGLLILRAVGPSMALANIFSFRLRLKVPDAYSSHR